MKTSFKAEEITVVGNVLCCGFNSPQLFSSQIADHVKHVAKIVNAAMAGPEGTLQTLTRRILEWTMVHIFPSLVSAITASP